MNILVNVQLKLMVKLTVFLLLEYFELLLSDDGFMSTKCICIFSFYFCYLFLTSMLNLEIKRVGRGQGILGCVWVRFFVVGFFFFFGNFHSTLGNVWSFSRKKHGEVCLPRKVRYRFPFTSPVVCGLSQQKQNGCSYLEAAYGVASATTLCWFPVSMLARRGKI